MQPRLTPSKRDGVLDRWRAVAHWYSESRHSPSKATTGRLTELREFRNSFEHTSRHAAIKINHSRLGTLPAYANLSDAMDAMAIVIEAASVLRHVLTGLDLMPQVVVPSKRHVFYLPLDHLV